MGLLNDAQDLYLGWSLALWLLSYLALLSRLPGNFSRTLSEQEHGDIEFGKSTTVSWRVAGPEISESLLAARPTIFDKVH